MAKGNSRRPKNPWQTVTKYTAYRGKRFTVQDDRVICPDGKPGTYTYFKLWDVAAVVPLDARGRVALVRQWRYVQNRPTTEIPSGCLEAGETDVLRAAKRELKEETGLSAKRWTKLGCYYQANSTRRIHCYLAEQLKQGKPEPDGTEDITVHWMPWPLAMRKLRQGSLSHGTTALAILRADQVLRARHHPSALRK